MKSRYFSILLGLSTAFLVVSQLLLWPIAMRATDGFRERITTLILSALKNEPHLDDAFTKVRRLIAIIGVSSNGIHVVAFSDNGTVIKQLSPSDPTLDPVILPHLDSDELQLHTSAFTDYTVFARLPNIKNTIFMIRLPRFGAVSRVAFLFMLGFNLWIIIGSTLLSMALIYAYFRIRARESLHVFGRIVQGDLKARFISTRIDEVGRLMVLFNRMADEIENLVNKLKEAQTQRIRLLQEISHDTRTPLTAARMSLEMIQSGYERLEEPERKRCIEIAHHEVLYLQYLIEDFFFMAEMDQPNYKLQMENVDLREIVEAELALRQSKASNLKWTFRHGMDSTLDVRGTHRLLMRLVRNALDNAEKFAVSEVSVHLFPHADGTILLAVENDGGHLTEDNVKHFGIRRPFQREAGTLMSGRSLGLGSVIMKKIASLHKADVRFSARSSGGARLEFIFKAESKALAA